MSKFKFRSTKLKQELQRRQRELSKKRTEFVLTVPPALRWWYFLEWGTGRQLEENSEHGVAPSTAPDRPGIRPRAFVRKALPDVRFLIAGAVRGTFQLLGVPPATTVRTAMLSAMEGAKAFIALSLKREAPGTRESGKLKGRSAGDVFFEQARVIERDLIPRA